MSPKEIKTTNPVSYLHYTFPFVSPPPLPLFPSLPFCSVFLPRTYFEILV